MGRGRWQGRHRNGRAGDKVVDKQHRVVRDKAEAGRVKGGGPRSRALAP